ncbi:MAG TPA: 50S ribosomal protein L10 [Candidatus Deferrimicrobium sp.]|nr:50S ribosomal protein L10 [Candidatus Deferrimicrobium sp.]
MPNPQKTSAVAEISHLFSEANAFFVTDYQGLNVADLTALRQNLRKNQVRYMVAKNTLLKLAAHQAGVANIDTHLEGPTAVAFCGADPALAAKILHDSFKDKSLPRMKVFVVEGQAFEGTEIKRLADLPPKPVLLAQLVAAIEAPIAELVGTLDSVFGELVGAIEALGEKKKGDTQSV